MPGELLEVLQRDAETRCQDDGIKCKVNKNTSKRTRELKAGTAKRVSRGVFCTVRALSGAGGLSEGRQTLGPLVFLMPQAGDSNV